MSRKREPSPELRPSTTPKFHLVQNTFDIFNNRVELISADTGYAKNPNRLKYFLKMVKIRRRVEDLLKTYPQWKPEPTTHDAKEADIPEHLQETLQRLAMPSRKYVVATFVKINEMINELKNDRYFYKNPYKARRIRELCGFRKQICCLYSKYHPEPDPSYSCYRFRPCSTKVTPIYAIARSSKNKRRVIKIKSRVLYFEFDDETVELALPSYKRIRDTFEFYKNMASQLETQICDHSESLKKKEILRKLYCAAGKRRDFLDGLKAEIECRKKIEIQTEEKNNKFAVEGTFDKKFESFTPYTHFLELPSKKKLKETLQVQKELLDKVKKEVEGAVLAKKCTSNSEKYSAKVENNVNFLQNILELYPVEEKPPHCGKPEEAAEAEKKMVSVKTITGEDGKPSKQYTFDPKTNELAMPKISILTKAKETHEELLKEFELDARKAANLKKPDPPAPKEASEEVKGPKKLPSQSQKNQMKAAKETEITKKDHAGLLDRTERLTTLLKAQTDRIEGMQTSKVDGAPSYMYHHMTCCAEQEVDCFGEYEMQSEHKPVTSSVATRCRVQASLEVYQNFFESRLRDVVFKKEYDRVLKALEETSQQDEGVEDTEVTEKTEPTSTKEGNEKSQPEKVAEAEPKVAEKTPDAEVEKTPDANACQPPEPEEQVEKVDKHLLQLVRNMKQLEKMLEENPAVVSCVHMMSHKKHETETFVPMDQRPVDEQRLMELAKPTKVRLRNTLEGFRRCLSPERQERIELQLASDASVVEKLVETAEKSPRVETRSKLEKAAALLKTIERKVTADMFDEIACELKRKLPRLVKKYKEPAMVTSYWINLRDIVLTLILSSRAPLSCQAELEVVSSFAGVITDFIIKVQLRSLRSQCSSCIPCSRPLRSVQNNKFLINLAGKLIAKLAEN